ncbi:hypothetical protein DCMF_08270 [Candidatus Formimonas warabiya]|uniref:Poly-gamma-glutamate hydrolase family protein n=2 Tax=Formimonas warabiya TaxID=1761012 RepID=A0A3G1L1W6_FORW1|nr:hypothetical protein DCMF_08270 [Candidatus Formimonas warabiya]
MMIIRKGLSVKRFIAFCGLIILMFNESMAGAFYDTYHNFKELSLNQLKDVDYKVETNVTDSPVIVIAIHGGNIEKGTTELAYALSSQNNYNYYSYIGLKSKDNLTLHVASDKFDEPTALEMVSKAATTLSIHGCAGSEEFTYIGGLDTELADKIKESLTNYAFTVLDAPDNLAGRLPNNIANKNMNGRGIQIEISAGLREKLLSDDNERLKSYLFAISEAVNSIQ